jgi:hypothetical protein
MKQAMPMKWSLPKWSLCALLSFFILSGVPSNIVQQKESVRTEQHAGKRSVKPNLSFVQFQKRNSYISLLESGFLSVLYFHHSSTQLRIASQIGHVQDFIPIHILIIANILPRSAEQLS